MHPNTTTLFPEIPPAISGSAAGLDAPSLPETGGHLPGRPRVLTPHQETELVALYLAGGHTMHGLSVRFDVSLSAVKRAVYRVTKPSSTSLH